MSFDFFLLYNENDFMSLMDFVKLFQTCILCLYFYYLFVFFVKNIFHVVFHFDISVLSYVDSCVCNYSLTGLRSIHCLLAQWESLPGPKKC